MRDDVLMRLAERASGDAEFRARAREDLDGALRDYGFELVPEELAAIRELHARVAGLGDEELADLLASGERRQGGM